MVQFEPPPAEAPRRRRRRARDRRLPTRAQILRRRLTAIAIAVALIGLTVLGALAGGGGEDAAPVSEEVDKLVRGLSPAEKVDAVLAVGFSGTGPESVAQAGIGRTQGGVVIGPDNWRGAGAGRALIAELRRRGEIPPLIIGRQEGGEYRAYPDLPPAEPQLEIADRGDPRATEEWAKSTGAALKRAGFDLNLAPVADVATLDAPLADRAFGDIAELVARMTAAAIRGCRAAGILCAPAHFPGAGAESSDTDEGPATVSLDQEALAERDLAPFRAAFAAGAPAVVLSHAFYAAYDAVTPASQSEAISTGLLRDRLGFEGVAITDDLAAGAIGGGEDPDRAAVRSIAAGADLVMVSDPGAAARARAALLAAVRGGELSSSRLDEAAGRVLELKRRAGLVGKP